MNKIEEEKEVFDNDNFLRRISQNIYLRNSEIEILEKYNINYLNYKDLSSIIYQIEQKLYNEYNPELEILSYELSERNYYQNTNK